MKRTVKTTLCGDSKLRKSISGILAQSFFSKINNGNNNITQSTIEDWYDKFRGAFANKQKFSEIPVSPFNLNKQYIGHDLPVWIEGEPFKEKQSRSTKENPANFSDEVFGGDILAIDADNSDFHSPLNNQKRVMIIGQDPMRINLQQNTLVVMSPWGLHSPWAFTKQGKFHNWIICPLLEKGAAVYVTDYYKLFATDIIPGYKSKRIADSRNFVGNYKIDYAQILEKEMICFNPTHIVVLGSISPGIHNTITGICNKLGITSINVMHPNARNGVTQLYYDKNLISKI